MMRRLGLVLPGLPALLSLRLLGQVSAPPDTSMHGAGHDTTTGSGHARTFTEGTNPGWLFSSPHIDLNAGLYHASGANDAFVRLHSQFAPGATGLVEIAFDLTFIPARGATPFVSGLVQFSPLSDRSDFYVNLGAGLITGHSASGDRMSGWLEMTGAYRAFHDFTGFVQAGHATGSGNRFEFLFGLAHPLAPYHSPPHHRKR